MTGKLPIALVVITQNEERNLPACLHAADFCSEIIVVDSGSTDRTQEVAQAYHAQFLHRPWTGYRDQKNFGTGRTTQPWVLCIDADEVVSPELRQDIIEHFRTEPEVDAFEINRHAFYAGRPINFSGWYPQWRTFLYRKGKAEWGGEEPHTVVIFHGTRKARLRGDLYHFTYSSIRHHLTKSIAAAHEAAVAMHRSGRRCRLTDLFCRSPWATFRSYVMQRGFLDGFYGLVIAVFAGFYTFAKYTMLAEMNQRANRDEEVGGSNR